MAPVVDYVNQVFSENDLALLSDAEFGDRIFELVKAITMRTKLLAKHGDVLDGEL